MQLIVSRKLDGVSGVTFGFSTRTGGMSPEPWGMNLSYRVGDDPANVAMNRGKFFGSLGIREEQLAIPGQCHSSNVAVVRAAGAIPETDALVTTVSGICLVVSVADCVPVFLADRNGTAVAAVHAGWRGSAEQIVSHTLRTLAERCHVDPTNVVAFLGPGAGPCCYEIGSEVAERFPGDVLRRVNGSLHLDMKTENIRQLVEGGVSPDSIEDSQQCTICNAGVFHSYRRDGKRSGRMMGVIGLKMKAE
ncbi:MAG: peptidoglycan editing factor PgeF [Bacteroidota bacterium]